MLMTPESEYEIWTHGGVSIFLGINLGRWWYGKHSVLKAAWEWAIAGGVGVSDWDIHAYIRPALKKLLVSIKLVADSVFCFVFLF